MPSKENASAKYGSLPPMVKMLNQIRATANTEYQERVPVATQDNIAQVGNPIINYTTVQNQFLTSLVNRIALVVIKNKVYNNPLAPFKKGLLSMGETVEELFVDIIKAQPYYLIDTEGRTDAQDAFERRLPNVMAAFHQMNRQDVYPTTISNDDLRTAFLSYDRLEDLVSKIITSLYTSDQYDEFILMKHLFLEAGNRGALLPVTLPSPTDTDTAKTAIKTIRETALKLTFMSKMYNYMGVTTHTALEDQYLFLTPAFASVVDVEVLAQAFNMDKAQFLGHQIIVDDFGGLENDGVVAILVDREWFMVYDKYISMTEIYNPARLYWNYFLHHKEILSYSPFGNAIAFTTTAPVITGVTVTPATASVVAGTESTLTFTAAVAGNGLFDKRVAWSIPTTTGVTIDAMGVVTVLTTAVAGSVTITATSVGDATKTGTATLTITSPGL